MICRGGKQRGLLWRMIDRRDVILHISTGRRESSLHERFRVCRDKRHSSGIEITHDYSTIVWIRKKEYIHIHIISMIIIILMIMNIYVLKLTERIYINAIFLMFINKQQKYQFEQQNFFSKKPQPYMQISLFIWFYSLYISLSLLIVNETGSLLPISLS